MTLTTIQKHDLQNRLERMTKTELDEVIDMVFEEGFKRDWNENQPPVAYLDHQQ